MTLATTLQLRNNFTQHLPTSGSGCPTMTQSSLAELPSMASLFCRGCMMRGCIAGGALRAAMAAVVSRTHEVRASPPRLRATTLYVPAVAAVTSLIVRLVKVDSIVI